MNDDVHDLLDQVLPEGPVPFTVEAPRVIAAGQRLRKRRRATTVSGVLAGVCAVALAVVLAPSIFASTNDAPGQGDRSTAPPAAGQGWDIRDYQRRQRDPLHNHATTALAGDLADTLAKNASQLNVHGEGKRDTVDFGRYTETSKDGKQTRKLLYSKGWLEKKHASDADFPGDFEVSIYQPGIVGSPKELVDCHAEHNACSWKTGESFPILKVTHTAHTDGRTVISYAVFVLRADKTVAKLVLTPAADRDSGGGRTLKPVLSADAMVELTLLLPDKVKV